MSDNEPIDTDMIGAYRRDGAPTGFAESLLRQARAEGIPARGFGRWALPAAAVALMVAFVVVGRIGPVREHAPLLAVSLSALPGGMPTLSSITTTAMPSVAALASMPAAPTMDLQLPAVSRIRVPGQPPADSNTLPN